MDRLAARGGQYPPFSGVRQTGTPGIGRPRNRPPRGSATRRPSAWRSTPSNETSTLPRAVWEGGKLHTIVGGGLNGFWMFVMSTPPAVGGGLTAMTAVAEPLVAVGACAAGTAGRVPCTSAVPDVGTREPTALPAPTWRAISAGVTPCSNRAAARMRRCSNAAKSRRGRTRPRLPMDLTSSSLPATRDAVLTHQFRTGSYSSRSNLIPNSPLGLLRRVRGEIPARGWRAIRINVT
jgi:hypothetical protein